MVDRNMKKNWTELWEYIRTKGDGAEQYRRLASRYNERHRYYHTLEHISSCLQELGTCSGLATRLSVVKMAIWYHDAIYNTRSDQNEERSAMEAVTVLDRAGAHPVFQDEVMRLILATKHTKLIDTSDRDAKLIVDIDLSILGQTPERFYEYERQIRQEYFWVPYEDFACARANFLEKFLKRGSIFSLPEFRDKYERQARANISRSIAKLR